MAVPAPAIPTGNAYTVNVAGPARDTSGKSSGKASGKTSALPTFAVTAAQLLRRWKVPVRMHLAGDAPDVNALRATLNEAGARPSAFSPAPSPEVPGEGFWKTTITVVEASDATESKFFWAEERDDKKVGWDPLLIALTEAESPADLPVSGVRKADLWVVSAANITMDATDSAEGVAKAEATAAQWISAGAAAVCVVAGEAIAWRSRGAVFGRSSGVREIPATATVTAHAETAAARALNPESLGTFAAGVVTGLVRDLLSENLFDKTLLRADRECLEMRPLRLGIAVLDGLAALSAAAAVPLENGLRGFPERAEACYVGLKGPASRPWAHKGR